MQDQHQDQHQGDQEKFTEEEFRLEMRDFVARLEAEDPSLREVRRQYLLDYIRIQKGMEIIAIENNVVYYKKVENK
jgi:hypothetical protein